MRCFNANPFRCDSLDAGVGAFFEYCFVFVLVGIPFDHLFNVLASTLRQFVKGAARRVSHVAALRLLCVRTHNRHLFVQFGAEALYVVAAAPPCEAVNLFARSLAQPRLLTRGEAVADVANEERVDLRPEHRVSAIGVYTFPKWALGVVLEVVTVQFAVGDLSHVRDQFVEL